MKRLAVLCVPLCLPMLAWAQTTHRVSAPSSFFEDADLTTPGLMSISVDAEYQRVYSGQDRSFPSAYFALGLNSRIEVSVSSGYVRSQFEDFHVNGASDIYSGAKVLLWRQRRWMPAIAVKPMIEVLGTPSIANNLLAPGRVNFVMPLILQRSYDQWRVYYMGGYMTRGLQFHSLAVEADRWAHVTPSVVVSHARLTTDLGLISELGLNRSRSDILGMVSVAPSPRWGFYGSGGSTFGRTDANSLRYQVSGGITLNIRFWGKK
jgi:hypothetical protein